MEWSPASPRQSASFARFQGERVLGAQGPSAVCEQRGELRGCLARVADHALDTEEGAAVGQHLGVVGAPDGAQGGNHLLKGLGGGYRIALRQTVLPHLEHAAVVDDERVVGPECLLQQTGRLLYTDRCRVGVSRLVAQQPQGVAGIGDVDVVSAQDPHGVFDHVRQLGGGSRWISGGGTPLGQLVPHHQGAVVVPAERHQVLVKQLPEPLAGPGGVARLTLPARELYAYVQGHVVEGSKVRPAVTEQFLVQSCGARRVSAIAVQGGDPGADRESVAVVRALDARR